MRWLKNVGRWTVGLLWGRVAGTWAGAWGNWRHALSLPMSWFYFLGSGLVTYVVLRGAFDTDPVTGYSFLAVSFVAWYFGHIFRDELTMVYVFVVLLLNGTWQTAIADLTNSSAANPVFPIAAFVLVVLYLWFWSERSKRSGFSWEPRWTSRLVRAYRKRG